MAKKIPILRPPEEVITVSRDGLVVTIKVQTILEEVVIQIGEDEALELRDQIDKEVWRKDAGNQEDQ